MNKINSTIVESEYLIHSFSRNFVAQNQKIVGDIKGSKSVSPTIKASTKLTTISFLHSQLWPLISMGEMAKTKFTCLNQGIISLKWI